MGFPILEKSSRFWMGRVLKHYVGAHGGAYFPNGGADSYDSLSKAIVTKSDLHWFTSEKLLPAASAYFDAHHSLSEEVMCYHYNEGLAAFDPDDLIIMYDKSEPAAAYGRWVKTLADWDYRSERYLNEKDFALLQDRTVKFLERRAKLRARNDELQSLLELKLAETSDTPEGRIVSATLTNHGKKALQLELGKLLLSSGEPPSYLMNDHLKPRTIKLEAGQSSEWKAGTFKLALDGKTYSAVITLSRRYGVEHPCRQI